MKSKIVFKKILFLFVLNLTGLGVYAQHDTTSYIVADLDLEGGVFLARNPFFQTHYLTGTMMYTGFGVKFGMSTSNVYPFIHYSRMAVASVTDSINRVTGESGNVKEFQAKKNQVSLGMMNLFRFSRGNYLQFKYGLSWNFIKEDFTQTDEKRFGFIMSVGFMKRISKAFSAYIDLGYDYAGTRNSYMRDWSGFIIKTGLAVNLAFEK